MNTDIVVTIHCLVFNHEPYLRQCLDGFVMQETNFKFEAIVHDDCSTDGSVTIINEYAEKYPSIIKPIIEKENQYSKNDGSLKRILNENTRGKYIAICEGDDYWTDPRKLQRQVDFLESHSDYVAVAENGWILNTNTKEKKEFSNLPERDVNINELVVSRKFPTASVMYKAYVEKEYLIYKNGMDTFLWCYLSTKGKIRYFTNKSSVYRRGPQGITEYTDPYVWAQIVEALNIDLIRYFGQYFDNRIAHTNIRKNYLGALKKYLYYQNTKGNYRLCLKKCLSLAPMQSFFILIRSKITDIHWHLIKH